MERKWSLIDLEKNTLGEFRHKKLVILREYVSSGLKIGEIAKKFNVTVPAIKNMMKQHNIFQI